jgi:nucleotide-binding universal stress UspA family protein
MDAAIDAGPRERDAGRMQQPVIATVDPLDDDAAPAALGLMLARLTGRPLLLAGAYQDVDGVRPELAGTDAEATRRRFSTLVESAPGARVRVATTVVLSVGSPARALHDLVEREGASIVVLGSSRRGQLGRVLPGAVTDRLLHGAPCPVAVAPVGFSFEDADDGPRRRLIGVAFTDTPDGRAALARGCILAARARGLVRVLTVSEPVDPLLAGGLDAGALEAVRGVQEDAAATVLRRGLDAVSVGRSAGGEILTGHPADALAAASADLDLLVCGSRGYGPLRTLLLGGTSHALVRKAACPVLVVPPCSPTGDTHPTRSDEHALAR